MLLPVTVLLRRAYAVEVIGAAVVARADGAGHRRIGEAVGVPAATVRGWLRRIGTRLETTRGYLLQVVVRAGVDRLVPKAQGSPWRDLLAGLAAATAAVTSRFGPIGVLGPVTAWQVLRAKLRMHLLLTAVPGAVLGVCLVAVCDFPAVQMAAVLALAAVFLVFSALMNLFLGLKMPNLHWTSEITPIKQSGAVAIALLGGWAYAAAMAALYFLVGRHMGFAAYMAAFLALTLAAAVLLYIWVRKKGCAIFASL